MDLFDIKALRDAEDDKELLAVAAKIKPLGKHVRPSARFMRELRATLVQLDARRAQAA